jgi:hypothetical protein
MIANKNHFVNRHCKKFDRFSNPDAICIPDLWNELRGLADVAPPGEAAGVHRQRTALLASVPSWQLPAVLDSLACEGVSA